MDIERLTSLNDLEKLDALLGKIDAVRFAIPAVLASLRPETVAAPSQQEQQQQQQQQRQPEAGTDTTDVKLQNYHTRVARSNEAINDLRESAVANEELLKRLLSQPVPTGGKDVTRPRSRKDPYSHRLVEKGEHQARWRTIPYPRTPSGVLPPTATLDAINETLESALRSQPRFKLLHPLSKANKRAFAVALADVAVFHVFLAWRPAEDGTEHAVFQRITAFAAGEDKRAYETSDFAVWREVSLQSSHAFKKYTQSGLEGTLHLETLLALLGSYTSLRDVTCAEPGCARLLHPTTLVLPTAKRYRVQASDDSAQNRGRGTIGTWHPFHPACVPADGP